MNNKYYGRKSAYSPLREDYSRVIASYGKEDVNEDYATWYEVYFYKTQNPRPSEEQIKDAIIADIDEHTKEDIIGGFVWNNKPVWLSIENQSNFATAEHRAATVGDNLPHKEKIGEQEDGTPIYHTFETAEELTYFWNACQDHIENCRKAGWERKDNINWDDYNK